MVMETVYVDVDEMLTWLKIFRIIQQVIQFDDYKFYLVHGYEETEAERIQKAKELGFQVVVSGHTHVKLLPYEQDGIIRLNPGNTTIPKDGTSSFAFYENGLN